MLFNSVGFLIFFVVVTAVYFLLPQKVRYIWLLLASYYFYMQWNPIYVFLLLSCTLLTYFSGIIIDANKNKKTGKIVLFGSVFICLCILCYYKYSGLIIKVINYILRHINIREVSLFENILLPVGISFFTLQSLGYVIDVYRGTTKVEKNFLKYALFVSFYPQLVAGPIERSENLLGQINNLPGFSYDNFRKGLVYILYGLFLKVMIADRCAIFVDEVYGNVVLYPGYYVVVATLLFALQIYCDFYGYSVIAKGAAKAIGINLIDNFNAPYYSKSIKEYWSRWHISLSSWFKDYLYIPLGGNRKGQFRKYLNLFVVFLVSGLWHGASFSFVLWGALNAVYQIAGELINKLASCIKNKFTVISKIKFNKERFSSRFFKMLVSFVLFDFAWLFFRAGSIDASILVLKSLFSTNNIEILFNGSLYELGIDKNYMLILILSIVVLGIVDYFKYKKEDPLSKFFKQGFWFRCVIEIIAVFVILLFGCYGEMYDVKQFIYFQF